MYDQLRGDRAAARANAEALLKLAEDQGLALWIGWSTGAARLDGRRRRRSRDGPAEMRRGIDAAHALGAALCHTYHLGLLADTLRRAGRYDEALATLDEADRLVQANEERFWESELLRVRGEVALQRGDLESAAEYLARAVAIAQRQGARSLELRSEASRINSFPHRHFQP